MTKFDKIDLGSVQVHRKVLSEIISSAIKEVDGVRLIQNNFGSRVFSLFGDRDVPGIDIKVDDDHEVTLEVKVFVQYGMNIPDAAKKIQAAIKSAVDKTLNVNIKDINVNVQGISRGRK